MRSIAIVKPDHLGDMVLSIPAIDALRGAYPGTVLYCGEYTRSLAQFLFPGLEVRVVKFAHLDKSPGAKTVLPPELLSDQFDALISFRYDSAVHRALKPSPASIFVQDLNYWRHETLLQKDIARRFVANYSRSKSYFRYAESRGARPSFPSVPQRIGLSVAAGFAANKWPTVYWSMLAKHLETSGREPFFVGGPKEVDEVRYLLSVMGYPESRAIFGGPSVPYPEFFDALDQVDCVIATDSGTAHLTSLTKPILSIFGPSPFRKFSPFGKHNRVISRDVSCSPCSQFDKQWANVCLSRECLMSIEPKHVLKALSLRIPDSVDENERFEAAIGPHVFVRGQSIEQKASDYESA